MAAAMLVFRDSMAEAARLRGAQDAARQAAAQAQADGSGATWRTASKAGSAIW